VQHWRTISSAATRVDLYEFANSKQHTKAALRVFGKAGGCKDNAETAGWEEFLKFVVVEIMRLANM